MTSTLIIELWGLSIPDWAIVLTLLGSLVTFFVFYRPEKLKRMAEAVTAKVKAGELTADRELFWQKYIQGITKEIQDINEKHQEELAEKDKQIKDGLTREVGQAARINELAATNALGVRARRRLFAKLDIPFWETDKDGKIEFLNGAWLSLFGMLEKDAIEEGWAKALVEADRNKIVVEWYARLRDHDDDTPLYFRIRNQATGEEFDVEAVFAIVNDVSGAIVRVFGVTLKK
jgi:PAS domain S-box-containing protein